MTRPLPSPALGRRVRVGAWVWLATALYFLTEAYAAAAWSPAYDWAGRTISELGVTGCGVMPPDGFVCSPRHALMNASFVVVGVARIGGAVLLHRHWPASRLALAATAGAALSGLGAVLVGLDSLDGATTVHTVGAVLQLPGALAPLLLGLALWHQDRRLAAASLLLGVVGSVATVLFFAGLGDVVGAGLLERLGFWPLTVWTAATGAHVLFARRRGA